MALDPDIAAADALTLSRINMQEVRDNLTNLKAWRAQQLAILQGAVDWAKAEYAKIPTEIDEMNLRYKRNLLLTLAEKYMTTSTSTVPATVQADAVNDTARLKAAYDEVIKLLP